MFAEVSGITACIKAIAADPDVKVMRVKNRLDPSFDGRQSAGYRNISMNLCITTAQTKALGIHKHICELQLLLQAVAEIKVKDLFNPLNYLPNATLPQICYALSFHLSIGYFYAQQI